MRIEIPERTIHMIAELLKDGDYTNISNKMYGNASARTVVSRTIANGHGDSKVVAAIVQYFDEKKKIVSQLQ